MNREEILKILNQFGINDFVEKIEIDSSLEDDYRLNIILDKKYVLRINSDIMTEERLASIDRLATRYRDIGVLAPRLYQSIKGTYLVCYGKHICYLSEYLDYPTYREKEKECDSTVINKEVLQSIGKLSARFTGVDLAPVNSMWSIIDLAPLDEKIDEKQENLNTLVEELSRLGETGLAQRILEFNEKKRSSLKKIYKNLPRCVIQGDLNGSNILVEDGHFKGVIDFNMAGTEVNVNHFCCETNSKISEDDFDKKDADTIDTDCIRRQQEALDIILTEYTLNELEKEAIAYYRSICRISMYPNVMQYLEYLKKDKAKMVEILERIICY